MQIKLFKLGLILPLFILASCANNSFRSCKTIEEAKQMIDKVISNSNIQYSNLCEEPRNDGLKGKFEELHDNLTILNSCGELCTKLSYTEQIEVSKYASIEINKYSNLKKLLFLSEIECW